MIGHFNFQKSIRRYLLAVGLLFLGFGGGIHATPREDLLDLMMADKTLPAMRLYYQGMCAGTFSPRQDDYGLIARMESLFPHFKGVRMGPEDYFFFMAKWHTLFRFQPLIAQEFMKQLADMTFFSGNPTLRGEFLNHLRTFLTVNPAPQAAIIRHLQTRFKDPLLEIFQALEAEGGMTPQSRASSLPTPVSPELLKQREREIAALNHQLEEIEAALSMFESGGGHGGGREIKIRALHQRRLDLQGEIGRLTGQSRGE